MVEYSPGRLTSRFVRNCKLRNNQIKYNQILPRDQPATRMSSNSSPAKSKGGLRSRIRHVSDTTKSLLKSTFGPGTQESLQTPTPGADPSSPVPLGGSKPRNKSDVCLSPASHTVTQQLSTSTPDLALSGQTPSTSRIAETVAEHAASNSGTTKNNPTGSNKYPDGSWKGLEMALKALHQTAKVFPPLQSAIGTMISCLELVQVSVTLSDDNNQRLIHGEGIGGRQEAPRL